MCTQTDRFQIQFTSVSLQEAWVAEILWNNYTLKVSPLIGILQADWQLKAFYLRRDPPANPRLLQQFDCQLSKLRRKGRTPTLWLLRTAFKTNSCFSQTPWSTLINKGQSIVWSLLFSMQCVFIGDTEYISRQRRHDEAAKWCSKLGCRAS